MQGKKIYVPGHDQKQQYEVVDECYYYDRLADIFRHRMQPHGEVDIQEVVEATIETAPDNPQDKDVVAVKIAGKTIGHLEARRAARLSPTLEKVENAGYIAATTALVSLQGSHGKIEQSDVKIGLKPILLKRAVEERDFAEVLGLAVDVEQLASVIAPKRSQIPGSVLTIDSKDDLAGAELQRMPNSPLKIQGSDDVFGAANIMTMAQGSFSISRPKRNTVRFGMGRTVRISSRTRGRLRKGVRFSKTSLGVFLGVVAMILCVGLFTVATAVLTRIVMLIPIVCLGRLSYHFCSHRLGKRVSRR